MHRPSDDGIGVDHLIFGVISYTRHAFIGIQSAKAVEFFQHTKSVQRIKEMYEATTNRKFNDNAALNAYSQI